MFPGGFRAKLNSRSHRRASVFATTVVALHPSFLSIYPLLDYAYLIKHIDRLKGEEWTLLACVSLGAGRALSFLVTRWNTTARAFRTRRSVGWMRRPRLYDCARKMSVTCLFFSPNKLIDYFPALWPVRVRVHVSTRYLRASVEQTRNLRPISISSTEKDPSSW